MAATAFGLAASTAATTLQSGPDGTFVNGARIPDHCPPAPIPRGPLAGPGLTDLPINHRAFAGETDEQMFERHKREAIADYNSPCRRDFNARIDAAMAAGHRHDAAIVRARGHEYVRRYGELYIYNSESLPQGFLVLRLTTSRVIIVEALEVTPDRYTINGSWFNCDLGGGDCLAFSEMIGEAQYGRPRSGDVLARVVRDARAGRLATFSNAEKFLYPTPW